MDFDGLTEEQKAKARACKTPEELVELAQSEGVELTDAQLEAISGGIWGTSDEKCENYGCPQQDYLHKVSNVRFGARR